jgi:D-alanyl-D-alanine carboxypeptidase
LVYVDFQYQISFAPLKTQKTNFMESKTNFKLSILSLVVLCSLLLFSCSKSSTGGGGKDTFIKAFSFQQADNSIPVSSTATISGSSINIFLPPGTNTNALIATFTLTDSGEVMVNGANQQSGVTQNNFSSPVTYTVMGLSGSIESYKVNLITGIVPIDQNVQEFMTKYNVPGLTIAITLDEHLVYLNAYGKASLDDNQALTGQSLFRISSLSKQITSAAIMRLLDQGKINLDQNVFGTGGILGNSYGNMPYGPGIAQITTRELLHHTEGGWPDNNTDPLGQGLNMTPQQIVSWGLNNVPLLDPVPGRSYYYSHFGYVILGRVIEQITGQAYADAVKTLVLQPAGITDMQIAGNTLAQKLPNEVKYYSNTNVNPYTLDVSIQDAANGWLSSAYDMAKFLVHVDGLSGQTILTPNSIRTMTTPSSANGNYACGWEVNQLNLWHDGRFPGTGTTEAITTQNGNFNYVILCNTSNSDSNFSADMENIFWNGQPSVPQWPSYDLFNSTTPN